MACPTYWRGFLISKPVNYLCVINYAGGSVLGIMSSYECLRVCKTQILIFDSVGLSLSTEVLAAGEDQ